MDNNEYTDLKASLGLGAGEPSPLVQASETVTVSPTASSTDNSPVIEKETKADGEKELQGGSQEEVTPETKSEPESEEVSATSDGVSPASKAPAPDALSDKLDKLVDVVGKLIEMQKGQTTQQKEETQQETSEEDLFASLTSDDILADPVAAMRKVADIARQQTIKELRTAAEKQERDNAASAKVIETFRSDPANAWLEEPATKQAFLTKVERVHTDNPTFSVEQILKASAALLAIEKGVPKADTKKPVRHDDTPKSVSTRNNGVQGKREPRNEYEELREGVGLSLSR